MEWILGGVVSIFFDSVLTVANSVGRITGPPVGGDLSGGVNVAADEGADRNCRAVVCGFDSYATGVIFSRDEN